MSSRDWDKELDKELLKMHEELYKDVYNLAVEKCETHSGVAVASTMIGIAMRLYRTALTDTEYMNMMEFIVNNAEEVEPYITSEYTSSSIH